MENLTSMKVEEEKLPQEETKQFELMEKMDFVKELKESLFFNEVEDYTEKDQTKILAWLKDYTKEVEKQILPWLKDYIEEFEELGIEIVMKLIDEFEANDETFEKVRKRLQTLRRILMWLAPNQRYKLEKIQCLEEMKKILEGKLQSLEEMYQRLQVLKLRNLKADFRTFKGYIYQGYIAAYEDPKFQVLFELEFQLLFVFQIQELIEHDIHVLIQEEKGQIQKLIRDIEALQVLNCTNKALNFKKIDKEKSLEDLCEILEDIYRRFKVMKQSLQQLENLRIKSESLLSQKSESLLSQKSESLLSQKSEVLNEVFFPFHQQDFTYRLAMRDCGNEIRQLADFFEEKSYKQKLESLQKQSSEQKLESLQKQSSEDCIQEILNYFESVEEDEIGFKLLNEVFSNSEEISLQEPIKKAMKSAKLLRKEIMDVELDLFLRLSAPIKNGVSEDPAVFNEWYSSGKTLIEFVDKFYEHVDRIHNSATGLRMLSASRDIFSALKGSGEGFAFTLANFLGELFLTCGLTFIENSLSKKILSAAEAFQQHMSFPNSLWEEYFKNLDSMIYNIFQHGIDKDIATEIYMYSSNIDEVSHKIFLAILASNVQEDVNLYKDKEFLKKAILVSTSEAGKQWFIKVIIDGIQQHLEFDSLEKVSIPGSVDMKIPFYLLKMWAVVSQNAEMRGFLSLVSLANLLFGDKPKILTELRQISQHMKKEMDKLQKIAYLLQ